MFLVYSPVFKSLHLGHLPSYCYLIYVIIYFVWYYPIT